MKTYYELIRELREDNDFNQTEIAQMLGIPQQTYSRYETGKSELPLKHLVNLCKHYNVSADYILGLETD